MRGTATWIVGAAVAVLVVVAVADGIRSRADASGSPTPRVLHGVIVAADDACHMQAIRLPSMAAERPARKPDCGGVVWSQDGSLFARCSGGVTSVTSGDGSFQLSDVEGCAPAWRADGFLSVVRDEEIVLAGRRGAPVTFFTRAQLAEALAGGVDNPSDWGFAEVSWFGLSSFVAVLKGVRSDETAIAVFAQGGLETFIPEAGVTIEDLHASPLGNFAFAGPEPEREYVMISRGGDEVAIPHVQGARALTWSPDELYVAIATDKETVIGRTGTTNVVTTLPFGARALDWLT